MNTTSDRVTIRRLIVSRMSLISRYKEWKNRRTRIVYALDNRPKRKFSKVLLAALLVGLTALGPILYSPLPEYALAATYTWTQSAWNGGTDSGSTADASDWTKYSSKDSEIYIDGITGVVSLATTTESVTHTSSADFNSGSPSLSSATTTSNKISLQDNASPTTVNIYPSDDPLTYFKYQEESGEDPDFCYSVDVYQDYTSTAVTIGNSANTTGGWCSGYAVDTKQYYMRFITESLPDDATITSAAVKVYQTGSGTGIIYLYEQGNSTALSSVTSPSGTGYVGSWSVTPGSIGVTAGSNFYALLAANYNFTETTASTVSLPIRTVDYTGTGSDPYLSVDYTTGASYAASGTYTSGVIDLGSAAPLDTITYNKTTPASTSLTVDVRAGDSSDLSAVSWTTGVSSGADISSLGTHRYVQYRANLSTSDASATPSLDDITINYTSYEAAGTLTSSAVDTTDAYAVFAKIAATYSEPSGGTVEFQIRSASSKAGLSSATWCGYDTCDGSDTFTTSDLDTTVNGSHDLTTDNDDRWLQYKIILSSDGVANPSVSDITLTYVINAPPDFDASFGGGAGITASQQTDGSVLIDYKIRDQDTDDGTATPGYVEPSFYYSTDNGSSWTQITASTHLSSSATSTKAVDESTYTEYTASWYAASTLTTYSTTAKIKVVVDDSEASNNTATAESAAFTLDTTAPSVSSTTLSASTTPATLAFSVSDNSSIEMRSATSLGALASASWGSYSSSAALSVSANPPVAYVQFRDTYKNYSATTTITGPTTPAGFSVQDITNLNVSPVYYGLFASWQITPDGDFASYKVWRSTDSGSTWALKSTITDENVNYYADYTVTSGTSYVYKVTVVDDDGNESFGSDAITATANGIQDGQEGGGGTSDTPPTISSVSSSEATTQSAKISWTTDTLSNSTVGYCADPCSDYTTLQIEVPTYTTSHSVYVGGLSAETTYAYAVISTDASGNTATSTGYTVTTDGGPEISGTSVIETTATTAKITWNSNESGAGVVTYTSSLSDLIANTNTSTASWPSNGTTGTASLSSLTKGTKYYFYVKTTATDDSDIGYDYNVANGLKNYYSFSTPNDVTAPTISGVASSTKRTSATITWDTDEISNSKVVYSTDTAYDSEETDSGYTFKHTVTVSDLVPNTTYNFKVVSIDPGGNSATSTAYSFTTETFDISDVTASTVSETAMDITWTTNEAATSRVAYSTSSNLSGATYTTLDSSMVTSHSVSLTGLSEGTTYYYKASSTNATNATATSQTYQFTTGDTVAPSISNLDAISVSDTAAVIVWDTNEAATSKVWYGTTSGNLTSSSALVDTLNREQAISITGLSSETTYYYIAVSADGNGNIATSSESSFTTLEEQIGVSEQNITTIVQGGGVSRALYDTLERKLAAAQQERDALQQERDELDSKYSALRDQVIGIASEDDTLTPTDIIKLVIDKFNSLQSTFKSLSVEEASSLEDELKPVVTSLSDLVKLVPPPELQTTPNVDIESTRAVIKWGTDKPATSVVEYTTAEKYDPENPDKTLTSRVEIGDYVTQHEVEVPGLFPDTRYAYRIVAVSEAGAKSVSQVFNMSTNPRLPEIASPRLQRLNDTTVVLSWDTTIPANSAVVYAPYLPNGSIDDERAQSFGKQDFVTNHELTLEGLAPATRYRFVLSSTDSFGNQVSEEMPAYTTTADTTAPAISRIRTEKSVFPGDATRAQVIIYWDTDEPATTQIHYAPGPATGGDDALTFETDVQTELTANHIVVITSWQPGAIYRFQAVSTDAGGNTSTSKTFTVLTPKQKGTVIDLIVDNFFKSFGWTQGGGQ